jgi:indolepyruvate ferredoxin oxidoreductase, beta subunit
VRRVQIVISGRGGQGIVFLTRLLGEAAGREGRDVLTAETHGMAQRGGVIDSFVKIGDFSGPLVRPGRADVALALDDSRGADAQAYLRSGGACFVNTEEALPGARCCPATAAARDLGSARSANLVLLGFAARSAPASFPAEESLLLALATLAPKVEDANKRALLRGCELARS